MPENQPAPAKGRFMISAVDEADESLAEFVRTSHTDPDIALVDAIGPPGQPHTVVVDVTADKARALAQRFRVSNKLLIEPDGPLTLFNKLSSP
jgi:hypothetical protein